MKRYSILLAITLFTGSLVHSSVGSCGAQVPVGTGTSGSVTLSSDCTELAASDFSGTTGYTISSPGKYCLTESFSDTDATTALISIESDDVILDFKGHTIDGGGTSRGITISGTRHNITIKDGTIRDVITNGITVPTAITEMTIEDFTINNCSGYAIQFAGTSFTTRLENVTITSDSTATGKGIEVVDAAQNFILNKFSIDNLSGTGSHALEFAAASQSIKIKNGRISDIGTGATTDAINFGAASYDVEIEDVNISNITGQGIDLNNSYNVYLKDITIANIDGGSAISIGNTGYHIEIENFKISDITTVAPLDGGIRFGNAAYGIIVNNGTINNVSGVSSSNGLSFTGTSYSVNIDDVTITNVTNRGIDLNSSYGVQLTNVNVTNAGKRGILAGVGEISRSTQDISLKDCFIDKTTGASSRGIEFLYTNNITLKDVMVLNSNNTTSSSDISGVLLNTCTNVKATNVNSSGHQGNGVQGFKLSAVNGAIFTNCSSIGNYAVDASETSTCTGFLVETSTAVVFNNCESSGHTAKREAQGFLFSNAIGCIAHNCVANGIRKDNDQNEEHPLFAGFYSVNGVGNVWRNCTADNNFAGNASTAPGDGAVGFYLSSELQSTINNCKARGHGALYNHTANAIGIYLDDTRRRSGMKLEDCRYCSVQECQASGNCTSATSGTTAYGIRDDSTDTTNIIMSCMAYGNKDSASPVVTTNYYMNLLLGGETKTNWPVTTGTMDSLIEFANLPNLYNIDIE